MFLKRYKGNKFLNKYIGGFGFGVSRIFDMSGKSSGLYDLYVDYLSSHEYDAEMIKSDWNAVGDALYAAMGKVNK